MTLKEILKLTYWWCQDLDQAQIKHELGLAESTGVDWDSFCREVCEITLLENSARLGGEGKIVQIDESKFGKGKYHRGCKRTMGIPRYRARQQEMFPSGS